MKTVSYTIGKKDVMQQFNDFCLEFAKCAIETGDHEQIDMAGEYLSKRFTKFEVDNSLTDIKMVAQKVCEEEPFLDILFGSDKFIGVNELLIEEDNGDFITKEWVCSNFSTKTARDKAQ